VARREALPFCFVPHLKREVRAPLGAPRRLFCPRDRASECPTGTFGSLYPAGFHPAFVSTACSHL